jgi:hypothetical protein
MEINEQFKDPLLHRCSMCGPYRLSAKERYIRDHFGSKLGLPGMYWVARWVCLLCVIWLVQTLDARPREDGYGSE